MKKILLLQAIGVLAAAAFPISSHAAPTTFTSGNFTFQFTQDGAGNTVVTGSGSGTAGDPGGRNRVAGFTDGARNDGPFKTTTTPAQWLVNPAGVNFRNTAGTGNLMFAGAGANTVNLTLLTYISGGGGGIEALFFNRFSGGPQFTPYGNYTLSGSSTFADPALAAALFGLYAPGTVLDLPGSLIAPGALRFIIGVAPVAAVVGKRTVRAYMMTNYSAIASADQSLFWVQGIKSATANAGETALNNLTGQIGVNSSDPGALVSNETGRSSSLLRYFAFNQDENMSYKVALGLADPDERTIEINMADTLSAQAGMNLNGATLGGGLPYAMMGVPMMPLVGGAATVHVVEAAPSGKTVIDDGKAVVESAPLNRYRMFASGDFSFYDQDPLSNLLEGFNTDTYAGSIGFDYRINDWLKAGVAWSYVQSDTTASGNLGDMDLEGNMVSVFASATWKQNWGELLYSYGSFDNEVNRNTGLGSKARGETDSDSHNIRLNLGHNIDLGRNIVHGPIAGLRYGGGDIDPYSETGGGVANMDFNSADYESMVGRLGWQGSHVRPTSWGNLISQVRLAWEHEFMPEDGAVGGSLQTSPFALVTGSSVRSIGGYSTEMDGAHPGTDWLSAGAGLRFELTNGVAVHTDYEGVFFRSSASQHYVAAKVSIEWGAMMSGGRGRGKSGSGKAVAYESYDASSVSKSATVKSTTPDQAAVTPKKKSAGDFSTWLARTGR